MDVDVIDADLSMSGRTAEHRLDLKDLIAGVTLAEIALRHLKCSWMLGCCLI